MYYEFSDRKVELESEKDKKSAYVGENDSFVYVTRWDRLDHARTQTGDSFFGGGWAYYSEYSAHMYGWMAYSITKWDFLDSCEKADIGERMDNRPKVWIPTILYGVFLGN